MVDSPKILTPFHANKRKEGKKRKYVQTIAVSLSIYTLIYYLQFTASFNFSKELITVPKNLVKLIPKRVSKRVQQLCEFFFRLFFGEI